jgi:hypothetical protein
VPGQLSDAVTVKLAGPPVAVAEQLVDPAELTLDGQLITGACVSLTVTVNVQLGPAVVVQVTVVVPLGKNEPEAGEQTVPLTGQLSVTVGGG